MACLMASLEEKTTYRSALFLSNGDRARDILQKKAIRQTISKIVREIAAKCS